MLQPNINPLVTSYSHSLIPMLFYRLNYLNYLNNIMLNLDLEGRMEIGKTVIEDIFQSETNENINMNSTKYKSLNYQINNQRLMLEKLLNYSEKYN